MVAIALPPPVMAAEPIQGSPKADPVDPNALAMTPTEELLAAASSAISEPVGLDIPTHIVYVRVAADEEWRAYYGSTWMTQASNRIEAADNAMYSNFGIDLRVRDYFYWDTYPDSSRHICSSLFQELSNDVPHGSGNDVVFAFTKNAYTGGAGCASGGNNKGLAAYQSYSSDWKVVQHEFGHIYNIPDRYPDPSGLHEDDVMEKIYTHYDHWCISSPYHDWNNMWSNSGKFD